MKQETSRLNFIYRNTLAVFASQVIQMLLGFISRKIFIQMLGVSYLGYNSVFQNLLSMLNLADLGVGIAITSFLYKPLAERDWNSVGTLMVIYRRIYSVLGAIVAFAGGIMALLLPVFIPDAAKTAGSLNYLRLLFFINLAGTVSTYYLAYKRTLLIADQRSYLTTLVDTATNILFTILQIVLLLQIPNYILFLVIAILKNVISNLIIDCLCNRRYRRAFGSVDDTLLHKYWRRIFRYVKDVFVSRLGAYVYYSTDSLVISSFKGSLLAGYLSNYTLITGLVQTVVTQLFSSLQATFGNYIHVQDDRRSQSHMASNYLFIDYLIANFCMCCVTFLIQPFIRLWLSNKLLLPDSTALLLGINLMLTILLIVPSQVFMIYQLYRFDKYIVIISAGINLVLSIILVRYLGINGVLIGTLVASLIYLFSRIAILCLLVFHTSLLWHYLRIFKYLLVSTITACGCYLLSSLFTSHSVVSFLVRTILVAICSTIIPLPFFIRTREFHFFIRKVCLPLCKKWGVFHKANS